MRYFTASPDLFNAIRDTVMGMLNQPNAKASQPWPEGISNIGLCPHEYNPPEFAAMIAYALANGAQEITAAEFIALQPEPELK